MLFDAGPATKTKKVIYLITSTILGIFLSFIAHALIEMSIISSLLSQNKIVPFYGGCALPPMLQIGLFVLGTAGGFFLGKFWWRKVYVERIWANRKSVL